MDINIKLSHRGTHTFNVYMIYANYITTFFTAWGYGFGFVSLIVFVSNVGALLGPCMKNKLFKRILMFCVALAVGTLAATGLLVLIPEVKYFFFVFSIYLCNRIISTFIEKNSKHAFCIRIRTCDMLANKTTLHPRHNDREINNNMYRLSTMSKVHAAE